MLKGQGNYFLDYKRIKEDFEDFNNFIKLEKERLNKMMKMNFYDIIFNQKEMFDE